ncbi:MAG: FHA domain-containing protein [Armatimonadota bacterium]
MSIDANVSEQAMDKTMVSQPQGAEATLLGTTITCPVCGTDNVPGEMYCGECGFLLTSTPGEVAEEIDIAEQPRIVDSATRIEHLLHTGDNIISREFADVILNDPTVSRKHARIILDNSKCVIEDMGSTNGTYVKGEKLLPSVPTEISDGDEIKIGSTSLIIHLPEVDHVDDTVIDESTVEPVSDIAVEKPADEILESGDEVSEDLEQAVISPVARLAGIADTSLAFDIIPGTNKIGRRSGNDIQISTDPYVSGSHAEIIAEDGKFWITDVGSTNGTSVNGTRLMPGVRTEITDGSELTLGQTKVKFEVVNEPDDSDVPSDEPV